VYSLACVVPLLARSNWALQTEQWAAVFVRRMILSCSWRPPACAVSFTALCIDLHTKTMAVP
jgi:hypothetical protein